MSDISIDRIIGLGFDQLINKVSRLDIMEEVGFGHERREFRRFGKIGGFGVIYL